MKFVHNLIAALVLVGWACVFGWLIDKATDSGWWPYGIATLVFVVLTLAAMGIAKDANEKESRLPK